MNYEQTMACEAHAQTTDLLDLFRGVRFGHDGYDDACRGDAHPIGGPATRDEHNDGYTFSPFTSWTLSEGIAKGWANHEGKGGILLQKSFSRSQVIESPDKHQEGEVLIEGPVYGAK